MHTFGFSKDKDEIVEKFLKEQFRQKLFAKSEEILHKKTLEKRAKSIIDSKKNISDSKDLFEKEKFAQNKI